MKRKLSTGEQVGEFQLPGSTARGQHLGVGLHAILLRLQYSVSSRVSGGFPDVWEDASTPSAQTSQLYLRARRHALGIFKEIVCTTHCCSSSHLQKGLHTDLYLQNSPPRSKTIPQTQVFSKSPMFVIRLIEHIHDQINIKWEHLKLHKSKYQQEATISSVRDWRIPQTPGNGPPPRPLERSWMTRLSNCTGSFLVG